VTPPFLSIIIPAYNEEKRLPRTLEQACVFVNAQAYPAEILIIENGSWDRTMEIAREFAARYPFVYALHSEPRGKGWAVRTGMLAATGDYRFICDADFSMPIEEINRFLPPVIPDAPIIIASREGPGAKRFNEPNYRHFIGRIFNAMVKIFALPGLQDSQCGFKCFRADVAELLFPLQTITGWTFDVEVLFIARQRRIPVRELGIPWHFNPDSKVRFWQDSWRMALDLLKIRWNSLRGRYDHPL
jgi:dolichyl-phosphate beta-glucosyltransferase